MKIAINFEHPYMDEKTIEKLTIDDLDCFYTDTDEVNCLNLFFILEASLHRLRSKGNWKVAARCSFLMAYYLFVPLTPPASHELAEFYIDKALEWDDMSEYRQWKEIIDRGN